MRQFLRLYLVVSSFLVVLASVMLVTARNQPIARYEPIDTKYQPGHTLTHDLTCEPAYDVMDYFHLYCQVVHGGQRGKLFVTFDIRDMNIIHTTLINPDQRIGDLILAWGLPVGFDNMILGNYVYWRGRYAYVAGKSFSPGSQVGYIVYDNAVIRSQPWSGFTNQRD